MTVEFVLDEPRGIVLSAIASEWSIINRKQSLEDNNFDLKRVNDAPGTGAFQFVNFVSGEKWELEAFGDYWNEGLPYLQGVELLHVPGAPNSCSGFDGAGPTMDLGSAPWLWETL